MATGNTSNWIVTPSQLPINVSPGLRYLFTHGGTMCELEITSPHTGVMRAKGVEYKCRVQTWGRS